MEVRGARVLPQPLLRREVLCSYPHPPFDMGNFCVAITAGEFCDSGRDLGFDEKVQCWKSRPFPEQFAGELLGTFQIRDQG